MKDPYSYDYHVGGQMNMAVHHAEMALRNVRDLARKIAAKQSKKDIDRLLKNATQEARETIQFLHRVEHARIVQDMWDVSDMQPSANRLKRFGRQEVRSDDADDIRD